MPKSPPAPRRKSPSPLRGRAPQPPAPHASPAPGAPGSADALPVASVSRRAADRIRAGQVWVYASEVVSAPQPGPGADAPRLLPVTDARGLLLGTALFSPASEIRLRLVSRAALSDAGWLDVFERRLRAAIARRRPLLDEANTAARLVFSEADELPGLVVDKYGDLVVLQLLHRGLDNAAIRGLAVRVLREEVAPAAIVERPDPRIRELEQLAAPASAPLFAAAGESALAVGFRLNGLLFHYDADAGQKTGAFLDQRDNYRAAARQARGRALDVCTYQGGFALHLAQVCESVTGVDTSRAALEVAERNLAANRERLRTSIDWVEADAFELLRDWSQAGERFDTIVLDPPAFARSQRAVEGALRGYKELNLRALRMLAPGGLLVSCSCSHHISMAALTHVVAAAAADAGRRATLVERRGAAPDHPFVLTLPETEYLKCLLVRVD